MTFEKMIDGIRQKDPEALAEALRLYEPDLRRAIRHCMADPCLRRVYSESDIIQSAFIKACKAWDALDTADPKELLGRLIMLVRRRIIDKARKEKGRNATRGRLVPATSAVLEKAVAPGPEPPREVEARDQLQALLGRLRPSERDLFKLRGEGHEWEEIAARLGGTAQRRRKQYQRALGRAAREPDELAAELQPSQ